MHLSHSRGGGAVQPYTTRAIDGLLSTVDLVVATRPESNRRLPLSGATG